MKKIENKLKTTGGILIQGPKSCGKTTTSRIFAKSEITLDDTPELKIQIENNHDLVLLGKKPRFIDEWQYMPWIWNKIRHKIDNAGLINGKGMYILSGSSSIPSDNNLHTGAMRISTISMKTTSLQEMNKSSEEVHSYIKILVEKEFRNANIKISKNRMLSLINSVSRNIGTSAKLETLAKEVEIYSSKKNILSTKTTRKYLDLLTQVFVLEELKPWRVRLRSSVRTKIKSKWYFVDPSIAPASTGYSKEKLENDWETFGLLFESLVVRDIRIYADYLGGEVYYYGDSTGLDIDIVVEFPNKDWAAFEIKLGGPTSIQLAKDNFKFLKNRLPKEKLSTCKSWNIITSENVSYTDNDGINIISIGHLYVK